jgi:hypothetical protein
VLLLSFLVSSPLSSLLLGALISQTSAPAALLPGVLVSALVFVLGLQRSGLWQYRYSGEPLALPEPARSSPAM